MSARHWRKNRKSIEPGGSVGPHMKRTGFACIVILLLAAAHAQADTIYKYRMPDDRILYAQAPQKQGRLLEIMPVRRPSERQMALAARRLEQEKARADELAAQRRETEAAQDNLRAALAYAQPALQSQCEPGLGEHLGTANGGSRLSGAYWKRMRWLRANY